MYLFTHTNAQQDFQIIW